VDIFPLSLQERRIQPSAVDSANSLIRTLAQTALALSGGKSNLQSAGLVSTLFFYPLSSNAIFLNVFLSLPSSQF